MGRSSVVWLIFTICISATQLRGQARTPTLDLELKQRRFCQRGETVVLRADFALHLTNRDESAKLYYRGPALVSVRVEDLDERRVGGWDSNVVDQFLGNQVWTAKSPDPNVFSSVGPGRRITLPEQSNVDVALGKKIDGDVFWQGGLRKVRILLELAFSPSDLPSEGGWRRRLIAGRIRSSAVTVELPQNPRDIPVCSKVRPVL